MQLFGATSHAQNKVRIQTYRFVKPSGRNLNLKKKEHIIATTKTIL
jgi:hypothetical protein